MSPKSSLEKPKKVRKAWWLISFTILFFLITPFLCVVGLYVHYSYDLPRLTSVKDYAPKIVTKVFSENGEIIAEFFVEKRYLISMEEMPSTLINAFIAAEDARFFEHQGIDFLSIFRAFIKNIESMDIVQGGSTITQQITKSLLLTPEKSYSRKIKEAILAQWIERSLFPGLQSGPQCCPYGPSGFLPWDNRRGMWLSTPRNWRSGRHTCLSGWRSGRFPARGADWHARP